MVAKSLLNGHSDLLVKIIVGLALAAVSTAIGYHQGQITELWRTVDHKQDIDNAPPRLYREYVDSQLASIKEDVAETKELVKELAIELRRHMELTNSR